MAVHYLADREAAQETPASHEGGPHAAFAVDVADADSARGLVEGVARAMGGIDVLVNNAAIFEAHPVLEVAYEGWQDAWSRTIAMARKGGSVGEIGPGFGVRGAIESSSRPARVARYPQREGTNHPPDSETRRRKPG